MKVKELIEQLQALNAPDLPVWITLYDCPDGYDDAEMC